MHHPIRIVIPALRAAALMLALLAGVASAQPAGNAVADTAFDDAMVAYERNHWDEAYAALVPLADGGHPQAARMALQMWRFGQQLYQRDFSATPAQLARWTRLWPCGCDADRDARSPARQVP